MKFPLPQILGRPQIMRNLTSITSNGKAKTQAALGLNQGLGVINLCQSQNGARASRLPKK